MVEICFVCSCLNNAASSDAPFGESLLVFCPLFQGPVLALTLSTGEVWRCQTGFLDSLLNEVIHVLVGQDPRRILLR